MGITLTNALTASRHEEDRLVSGGKALVQRGKDWFPLVSRGEGLVSAGFRVVSAGFRVVSGWFRLVSGWFRLVSCGKDWFRVVSARSAF